jgi:peptidoglycan/xylan/chitin deacetylase (PgdA/CDA1 family)
VLSPGISIRTEREFKNSLREGVPILTFHKIGRSPRAANLRGDYVSPRHFAKLLDAFKRNDLHSVSLSETVRTNRKVGRYYVITFDDGFEGILIHAAPKMKEAGFTGIVYLVANRLGQRNEWNLGLDNTMERLLDRIQVQEWLSLGFEIGAHTLTHPWLTTIPILQARNEIADSKKKLEDLFGVPVKHFCYPYGDYNDALVDLVREAGFETACTVEEGTVRHGADPFRLPRFHASEKSFKSFLNYKPCHLRDDLKDVARRLGILPILSRVLDAYRSLRPRTSQESLGDILRSRGKLEKALQAYRHALDQRRELLEQTSGTPAEEADLSDSYERVGTVLLSQGKLEEALKAFGQAVRIRGKRDIFGNEATNKSIY